MNPFIQHCIGRKKALQSTNFLSGHYGVYALVRMVGRLVARVLVATYKILKIPSDFKNSKTKICFRPFWVTLIFWPRPPFLLWKWDNTRFGLIQIWTPQKNVCPKKFCPKFFPIRFQKYFNQDVFQTILNKLHFWTQNLFGQRLFFFIKFQKYFD